ncbi:hypothetical protein [Pseudomonas aeruginosa]|uniref:hypothetical protein n=2 Tax=Pseudomonas aeruginosa TaxID=287 RepID=UPI000A3FF2D4|nr:hypothetical protein [Pseudomonas aeruginosa]
MSRLPGYKVRRLAALLEESFPQRNGLKITWRPEQIYPAQGRWRSDVRMDVWRWEAFGVHIRSDGTETTMMSVGSYATITELIKFKALELHGDEVYGASKEVGHE